MIHQINRVMAIHSGGAVDVRMDRATQRIYLGTLATREVEMTEGEVRTLIGVLADQYTSLTGRRPFARQDPESSADDPTQ